ncbi:MAG: type I 3-dehydroquinate dehydratase [Coprobacillus sp.]
MNICQVKNLEIGNGKPKICLPIVGRNNEEIFTQAKSFQLYSYDMVELRIDFYENILDENELLQLLKQLKTIISQPLLFTYRSKKEGGEIQLTDQQYIQLIQCACESHFIDLVDIELMSGNTLVYQLVEIAHKNNVKVIMSNHDFEKTPSVSDMMNTLEHMEILGGDILKIAVMPQSYKDVIALLNVTLEMSQKATKPIVTMSMGQLGAISRISGELTGSAITFASAGKASAPGQIGVSDMQVILEAIHHD